MQNIHFLKKSKNKNLIRYLLDFFTLEEKIQKMKINRIFFKSLNDQIVFKELRILNIELRRYKELVIGILLDNNSEILMKILKTFKLSIKDDILVNWFSYNIIEYDVNIPNILNWNINNFKYFLIYADEQEENSIEITLGNPLTKHENNVPISPDIISDYNQKLTTILLNKNKLLIIPFKWFYHLNIISGNPRFFGIHDYITYGLSFGVVKKNKSNR